MIIDELQRYYDGIAVDPLAEQRVIMAVTSHDYARSARHRTVWLVAAAVAIVAAVAAATIGIQSAFQNRSLPPAHTPPAPFVITFHAKGVTLGSIACSSATDCTAAGAKGNHGVGFAFAGGEWHAARPGSEAAAGRRVLHARRQLCLAARFGVAAWRASRTSGWHQLALPAPLTGAAGATVPAVDCPSATACVTVGVHPSGPSGAHGSAKVSIAFAWNGRSWARLPNLPVRSASQLGIELSCWAADGCRVITLGSQHGVMSSSMLTWDGSRWSAAAPFSATTPARQWRPAGTRSWCVPAGQRAAACCAS